jgi:hypothetical protein
MVTALGSHVMKWTFGTSTFLGTNFPLSVLHLIEYTCCDIRTSVHAATAWPRFSGNQDKFGNSPMMQTRYANQHEEVDESQVFAAKFVSEGFLKPSLMSPGVPWNWDGSRWMIFNVQLLFSRNYFTLFSLCYICSTWRLHAHMRI